MKQFSISHIMQRMMLSKAFGEEGLRVKQYSSYLKDYEIPQESELLQGPVELFFDLARPVVGKANAILLQTKDCFLPVAEIDDVSLETALHATAFLRGRFFGTEDKDLHPASLFFSGGGFHILFGRLTPIHHYEDWQAALHHCRFVDREWLWTKELWLRVSPKAQEGIPPVLAWRDDGLAELGRWDPILKKGVDDSSIPL